MLTLKFQVAHFAPFGLSYQTFWTFSILILQVSFKNKESNSFLGAHPSNNVILEVLTVLDILMR